MSVCVWQFSLLDVQALISDYKQVRVCVADLDKRIGASGELPQSEVKRAEVPRPLPESSCQSAAQSANQLNQQLNAFQLQSANQPSK